jgi:hypothetical protein
MSYNETKAVLRVEIPELKGKSYNELYQYFKDKIGEPSDVYKDGDYVEWFAYDERLCDIVPVIQYSTKRVGVDYILSYSTDFEEDHRKSSYTLEELNKYATILAEKFGVEPNKCRLFFYTWYNGADEPIEFE